MPIAKSRAHTAPITTPGRDERGPGDEQAVDQVRRRAQVAVALERGRDRPRDDAGDERDDVQVPLLRRRAVVVERVGQEARALGDEEHAERGHRGHREAQERRRAHADHRQERQLEAEQPDDPQVVHAVRARG